MHVFASMRDELEKIAVPARRAAAWAAERVLGPAKSKLTGSKLLMKRVKSQSGELRGAHRAHQGTIQELGSAKEQQRAMQAKLKSTQKGYQKMKGIAAGAKGQMSPLMAGGIGAGAGLLGASMLRGGDQQQ